MEDLGNCGNSIEQVNPGASILEMMTRLCHSIAFEKTGTRGNQKPLDGLEQEEMIQALFDLTRKGQHSPDIANLAESFGLMLVKLETRELKQEQLIEELQSKNRELEVAKQHLDRENRILAGSLREKYSPGQFVGQCPRMQAVNQTALNIAQRPINTLVLGDSGTGKEVFAKIIHYNSPRADRPFVAVNCTAIPDSLFESEMFGIEKGVATGVNQRRGFFEQAHTGTIFLDEIGDLGLVNQAKLLRVLEEREVMRVGGDKSIPVDLKIISATNADLKTAVSQGKFREDLFYRLNVVELTLPPLRERGEDILILAEKLLRKNCRELGREPIHLSRDAKDSLMAHDWPGNVRELNNEMERAAALTLSGVVSSRDLSPRIVTHDAVDPGMALGHVGADLNLNRVEQQVVNRALERTGHNKTKAAELLGITREGLRKKLIRFQQNSRCDAG
ncbi:MAG: sigma-54 dependent transcriptional regulator [Desulfobacterales bacterium]|nr:sigma-54 dependent transcriptional regulator [Desulfobacterales bacterium]